MSIFATKPIGCYEPCPMDRYEHKTMKHAVLAFLCSCSALAAAAGAAPIDLRPQSLDLPGPPAAVLSADVDGDGRRDLVVLTVATSWDQIGVEESSHMDEALGLVEVMTVVPALLEHRQLAVYSGKPDGTFAEPPLTLAVDGHLLSLGTGPSWAAVLALTDDGVSTLRVTPGENGPSLTLVPLLQDTPVLAGSGTFVPDLLQVIDVDGDGKPDLLFPGPRALGIYRGADDRFVTPPVERVQLPLDDPKNEDGELSRHYPLPVVRDVDGDGLLDLLVPHPRRDWNELQIWRGLGGGRFAPPIAPLPARPPGAPHADPSVVYFGDIDGDHRAEYVLQKSFEPGKDASMREELAHAKQPPFAYQLLHAGADLAPAAQPYREFKATGYAFEGGSGGTVHLPGGLIDLNGDGRQDLVSITLDFSLFQAFRVLATKRIGIGLDFHIACQQSDGSFRDVPGLDLSGKFTLDLNDLRIGNLAQFAGDFDGDGKLDFLQIGRGKTAAIHRGRADCSYPARPDAEVDLREEPANLALLKVLDLNGDGKADLLLIQPQDRGEGDNAREGASSPVRLDLYVSGGGR